MKPHLPRRLTGSKTERRALTGGALFLLLLCLLALPLFAAPPPWWAGRGATDTNAADDFSVVNQGQLKNFTQKAVQELDASLPGGGAGATLDDLVQSWIQDYQTNGYSATNPKPSDFDAMTVGQLKYIGNMVWNRLVDVGYAA